MMKKQLLVLGSIAFLSACSGAGAVTTPGTFTDICNGEPPIPPFTLTSPTAGATNVSDSTAALLFTGTPYTVVGPATIKLSTAAGVTQTLTTFNPTSNGYSVPLAALSPSTTYTVTYVAQLVANGTQSPCSSTMSQDEGSFTTQ
jgi:hypothetical protein